MTTTISATARRFAWSWQGSPIEAVHEQVGSGAPVLLLPAFSTVSTREELRPLAERLADAGFGCTLVDWPGFGASTRGRLDYGPEFYRAFLAGFAASCVPAGAAVIAAGHAAGYALGLERAHPGVWRRIVLLAPTWRGPLPTAMGPHPRAYAIARSLVRAPVLGQALYRLNTGQGVIAMMYRRHVYADPTGVTPAFVSAKQRVARGRGGRFASVAFVTGALDPLSDRAAFAALLGPPSAPTLILCGQTTPPKTRAEMLAIAAGPGVELRWVEGSLGLHEERAGAIAAPIAEFLAA